MESEQPTAGKSSTSIEEPQTIETPIETGKHNAMEGDLSTGKVQTTPTGKLTSFLCDKHDKDIGISKQKPQMQS